jgi:SET domain-containing protein
MNHSCTSNTEKFTIGDILFVKSTKDIKKGEEITTMYVPHDFPYFEKQRRLSWY